MAPLLLNNFVSSNRKQFLFVQLSDTNIESNLEIFLKKKCFDYVMLQAIRST